MNAKSLSTVSAAPDERALAALAAATRSTLVMTCLLFLLRIVGLVLHEGGHGLHLLAQGLPVTLYVHPFAFSGYARPMGDFSVWTHASGPAVELLSSLLIFLLLCRRPSVSRLPLLMLFPFAAFKEGQIMIRREGDFHNLLRVTGLPDTAFIVAGAVLAVLGLVLLFSLFSLLGLSPRDPKALIIVPTAMLLWGVLSILLAQLVVPGSWIDTRWHLAQEILSATDENWANAIVGALLALLYLTLYPGCVPGCPLCYSLRRLARPGRTCGSTL
jgi:hypothetical protein